MGQTARAALLVLHVVLVRGQSYSGLVWRFAAVVEDGGAGSLARRLPLLVV